MTLPPIQLAPGKKLYFASDLHFGFPTKEKSFEREKLFIKWLTTIEKDASELFLVGDIFDFWYEYKYVVPKGFIRLFGKLATMSDAGIKIHFFTGNHDIWVFNYLQQEIGMQLYRKPISFECNGKKIYIGHGDGLGPGDHAFKLLKSIFTSKILQKLYSFFVHPDLNFAFGNAWSKKSSKKRNYKFYGVEKEWLILYSREILQKSHYDYFVFGHRHWALDYPLSDQSRYINLGDWLHYNSFGVFDGEKMYLQTFSANGEICEFAPKSTEVNC